MQRPVWTPDGHRVAFSSTRDRGGSNLFWQRVDGAAQAERLTSEPNSDRNRMGFRSGCEDAPLHSGRILIRRSICICCRWSAVIIQSRCSTSAFIEGSPALSPDGRWIAYRSDETGRLEIYVRPFPNVDEGKWPITTDGGTVPVWAPSGRELFYQNGDSVMVVPIETEPTFTYGKPQVLFSWSLSSSTFETSMSHPMVSASW